MRKIKTVQIEPIKVLHRSLMSGQKYEAYEAVGLTYHIRRKPHHLIDSDGKQHFLFQNVGLYKDTEENRETLSLVHDLETQRNLLNRKISATLQEAETIHGSTLHERTIPVKKGVKGDDPDG